MYEQRGLNVLYVTDDGSTLLMCEASAPIHAQQICQALNAWHEIQEAYAQEPEDLSGYLRIVDNLRMIVERHLVNSSGVKD